MPGERPASCATLASVVFDRPCPAMMRIVAWMSWPRRCSWFAVSKALDTGAAAGWIVPKEVTVLMPRASRSFE